MARKAKKQKKDFFDGLVARLTKESVDSLIRNCTDDTVIVDLTALSDGREQKYRVRRNGEDILVSMAELKGITGRTAVFACMAPDMFLRSPDGVELRQESRRIIRSMLAGATITRIVDRKEFFPSGGCENYGLDGNARYVVYSTAVGPSPQGERQDSDGKVSVSDSPQGELYDGDWTLDIGRTLPR